MTGILRVIATIAVLLHVVACAHAPPASDSSVQGKDVAVPSAHAGSATTTALAPKLSPEQGVLRLLELIRSSQAIADFTPERLTQVMGVEMTFDGHGRYGFEEQATPDWNHSLLGDRANGMEPRFVFAFKPVSVGSLPSMTDVCQIDFERFAAELEAIGFARESWGGALGAPNFDVFRRSRMTIQVYPERESKDVVSHLCVRTVGIHSPTDGTSSLAAISSKPSAKQALLRLLELIRSSQTIADFTPERLTDVMGLKLKLGGVDRYGAGEELTSQWGYGFHVDRASRARGPFLDFSFHEKPDNVPMTDICQLDFDQFTAALEAMGFDRERIGGPHGGGAYYDFSRPGLAVEVYPQGESSDAVDHLCITMVRIY